MAKTHFDIFMEAYAAVDERERHLGGDVILCPPDPDYGYDSTPANAFTFAAMGVDGVHWSILTIDGRVRDDSPIVYVSPMDSDDVIVMGESLLSFLSVNCGASIEKMEAVFETERSGDRGLVEFLAQNFRRDDMLNDGRITQLGARLSHLIERKPGAN